MSLQIQNFMSVKETRQIYSKGCKLIMYKARRNVKRQK